jgi:hypothetical protein
MADSGKPSATISGAADGGGEATPASPTSGRLATAPISSSNAGVSIAPAPSSGGSTPSAGESAPDTEAGGVGGKKNHRLHRAEREADFIRVPPPAPNLSFFISFFLFPQREINPLIEQTRKYLFFNNSFIKFCK